jgi:peptidoglycan/xylan/chitin deacetylase (PgdA/CDA1 family)
MGYLKKSILTSGLGRTLGRMPAYLLLVLLVLILLTACLPTGGQVVLAAGPSPQHLPSLAPTRQQSATPPASRTPFPPASPSPFPTATATPTPTVPEGMIYQPTGPVAAPILLYHRVSNRAPASRYAVRVETFRAQMIILANAGFQTITVSQLADIIRNGGYMPEKTIVITFDDGFLDVYENAFPILQEFGFTATFYVITGTLDSDKSYGYAQKSQLEDLMTAGWEIASHSISHTNLKTAYSGHRNEMENSKFMLEEMLGVPIRSFAYPFAAADQRTRDRAREFGYESAVGVGLGALHTSDDLYFLSRREVYNNTSLNEFQRLLITPTPASSQ